MRRVRHIHAACHACASWHAYTHTHTQNTSKYKAPDTPRKQQKGTRYRYVRWRVPTLDVVQMNTSCHTKMSHKMQCTWHPQGTIRRHRLCASTWPRFFLSGSYVWHDAFIRVKCCIYRCDMKNSYMWHDTHSSPIWEDRKGKERGGKRDRKRGQERASEGERGKTRESKCVSARACVFSITSEYKNTESSYSFAKEPYILSKERCIHGRIHLHLSRAHIWISCLAPHIWMSHEHMNESWNTHAWVTSHLWMSHITHMKSCQTYVWVIPQI